MECGAKPYSGNEPYLFFLSGPADHVPAWPVIEQLARQGLRIWHDGQIRKDESSYGRLLRGALEHSSGMIVLMTEKAAESHVFRKVLNWAVEMGKPMLILDYGSFALSPAMRLQAGRAQAALGLRGADDADCIRRILSFPGFRGALGAPDQSVVLNSYPAAPEQPDRRVQRRCGRSAEDSIAELRPEDSRRPEHQPEEESTGDSAMARRVIDNINNRKEPEQSGNVEGPTILSLSTGCCMRGQGSVTTVGRLKPNAGTLADLSFPEESKFFSRKHFQLALTGQGCRVACIHPNGVSLDGYRDLGEKENAEIASGTIISVPSRATLQGYQPGMKTVSFLVAFGQEAEAIWGAGYVATLQSENTGEIIRLGRKTELGRANPWKSGAFASKSISSRHATITDLQGSFTYEDHSTNGSVLNGRSLRGAKAELHDGDRITLEGNKAHSVPDENYIFRLVRVQKGAE